MTAMRTKRSSPSALPTTAFYLAVWVVKRNKREEIDLHRNLATSKNLVLQTPKTIKFELISILAMLPRQERPESGDALCDCLALFCL